MMAKEFEDLLSEMWVGFRKCNGHLCHRPPPRMPPVPGGTFVRKDDEKEPRRFYKIEQLPRICRACGATP